MIEWQHYPGSSSEDTKYAVLNDRKAEITKGEGGAIFVKRYEKMLALTPGGKAWWGPTGGSLRLVDHQAAKEYAERWLTGGQEGQFLARESGHRLLQTSGHALPGVEILTFL